MNITSLELCEELYELSGWVMPSKLCHQVRNEHGVGVEWWALYDLGYLLRKLPRLKDIDFRIEQDGEDENGECWVAYGQNWASQNNTDGWLWRSVSNTPEDAVAKLAIKLFKQGILTKGDGTDE